MKYTKAKFDAATIKNAISPYDFYLREQNLARYGNRSGKWVVAGLCPFHEDSNPGSFKINVDTGAFKCWSCGVGGGDVIAFLQQRDDLGFIEVLKRLSREWEVYDV